MTAKETLTVKDRIHDLARRVQRLSPSHRDPERYHVEKSEIEHELRRIAKEARMY